MTAKITQNLSLDGYNLTLSEVCAVARHNKKVELSAKSRDAMKKSRSVVDKMLAENQVVYGVTTGFGKFKDVRIDPKDILTMQENFLRSHAAGVGPTFDEATVRAISLLRVNALAKGYSGIRTEVVDLLLDLLNKQVHPVVPEQGSVGASGDLAPLAHLSLTLIGEGKARYKGETLDSAEALKMAGLKPVVLEAKEGLALTNGTQVMSAVGALAVDEGIYLCKIADIIGAMTLEALLGSRKPMMSQVHELRPHKGQIHSASNLTKLLANSEIMESHMHCNAVQDAYSLRCMPQVHGASRQAVYHAQEVLEIEFNAVTDNPLVIDGNMVSQGNFHGQPIALVMDYFAIAMSELANISERRLERLVNPTLSRGLPPFLTIAGGLNSGYMIAQYTAAALVSENKTLCHPASVDSIPTSANQEDHVSMGTIGSRKARDILKNTKTVLAIELLCALQALDLRLGIDTKSGEVAYSQADIESRGKRPGAGVEAAYKCARQIIPFMEEDRPVWLDIEKAIALLDSRDILGAVEKTVGDLD